MYDDSLLSNYMRSKIHLLIIVILFGFPFNYAMPTALYISYSLPTNKLVGYFI